MHLNLLMKQMLLHILLTFLILLLLMESYPQIINFQLLQ